MKKLLTTVLTGTLMFAFTLTANAQTMVFATRDINLRQGPGKGYAASTSVVEGTEMPYQGVTSIDNRGVAWHEVSYKGQNLWVSSKYAVTRDEADDNGMASSYQTTAPMSGEYVCTNSDVNLRVGPGTDCAAAAVAAQGTALKFLGETGEDERGVTWYNVAYGDQQLWVNSHYSTLN